MISSQKIISEINYATLLCNDKNTDSYESYYIKQELYKILWAVEESLKKCPKFSIEDEWIKEQEHLKIINYLKK
jgi:hypothetical protein